MDVKGVVVQTEILTDTPVCIVMHLKFATKMYGGNFPQSALEGTQILQPFRLTAIKFLFYLAQIDKIYTCIGFLEQGRKQLGCQYAEI